jgi:2-dehydro-3-deoxy-D-arabinonate dehydratase
VPTGLFRVRLADGSIRLARGDASGGPRELLAADVDLDALLGPDGPTVDGALELPVDGVAPPDAAVLAPVQSQEVWAAGVTYLRSREARVEESLDASPYDRVYAAERPELFFKSAGWRVRGPGAEVAIRADSPWNTPEPELTLVLDASMAIAGYTIGDDVSSRTIEGENPLYLPQAKVYDGACAMGPCIVPASVVAPPFAITLRILRSDAVAFEGTTSTERMKRRFDELAAYLGRAMEFPVGAFLLTGTGIVPDAPFTLRHGDVVRIEIDGLGALENPVTTVGAPRAMTT